MKILIWLFMSIVLLGCAVEANRHGDFMQIKGWGAKSAEWEDSDGHKFAIEKEEPIKIPDIVPLRS